MVIIMTIDKIVNEYLMRFCVIGNVLVFCMMFCVFIFFSFCFSLFAIEKLILFACCVSIVIVTVLFWSWFCIWCLIDDCEVVVAVVCMSSMVSWVLCESENSLLTFLFKAFFLVYNFVVQTPQLKQFENIFGMSKARVVLKALH